MSRGEHPFDELRRTGKRPLELKMKKPVDKIRITQVESVNHPAHYMSGGIETIDAIEAWDLGFHLGNAVKYISRAGKKGDALEDLKKARWYLDREIARRSKP